MPVSSADYTLGVEEEYQLVDAETGELRSRARAVLAGDWSGDIKREMQQHTVEVDTCVCACAGEAEDELRRLRLQAAAAAGAQGMRIVAAGTHPFTSWEGQEFTDDPTYDSIRREYRQLAREQTIFGMHVHVGIPAGTDTARILNVARLHLPALLALSVSSPLYLGDDTGYASYRSMLWRRWPRSGPPPRFTDEAELDAAVELLLEAGGLDSPGRLYWAIRPHHRFPTIEFRVCDVTPRVEDAALIATLARALVASIVSGTIREPDLPESHRWVLLDENLWRAARDGLAARWAELDGSRPREIDAAESLRRLADRLAPTAEELGDGEILARLPETLKRGDAAARIRARAREVGTDAPALVDWLATETTLGLGLDRRSEQRVGVAG
ncbi:carboxylate-amine ligase [soil metagenome]